MQKAFTLIELLVVVLIIGILAAITVPQYQKAVDKTRYASLMTLTRAIADAQEVYYLANNEYATDFTKLDIGMPATNIQNQNTSSVATFQWGDCYLWKQQEVQCSNITTLKNEYVIQYPHGTKAPGQKYCNAITREAGSRFDKVCSHLGKFFREDNCLHGSCRTYILKD